MTTTPRTLALSLTAILVLAGCAADAADAGGGAGESATVRAADGAFSPASLEVTAGDTVTWVNDDDVAHSVAFDDESLGASDLLETGDEHAVALEEPGTFGYVCAVHPEMTGSVSVAAAS